MRTLFYPPLNDDQIREDVVSCGVVRCGAHSDYGTVTFLYQVMHSDSFLIKYIF